MRGRDLLLADAHSADQLVVPLDVVLETLTSSKSLAAGAAFERLHLKNYYSKNYIQKILFQSKLKEDDKQIVTNGTNLLLCTFVKLSILVFFLNGALTELP